MPAQREPVPSVVLARAVLDAYGGSIERVAGRRARLIPDDEPGLIGSEAGVDVVVADLDEQVLEPLLAAPSLRWVHALSSGVDHLPVARLDERGVLLTNSAGAHAPAIAEYAVAAMVMLSRGLPALLDAQRAKRWQALEESPAVLRGKRLGVVGYGSVGRHLAGICKALGMEVWATRRRPLLLAGEPLDRFLPSSELAALLSESDVVVISASLNDTTSGLIGDAELRRMKPSAVLVNVARGVMLDETALEQALREGRLAGAMLDVTQDEPLPPESSLWTAPNLVVTPHVAGNARETLGAAVELFCANLELFLAGEAQRMANLVECSAVSGTDSRGPV